MGAVQNHALMGYAVRRGRSTQELLLRVGGFLHIKFDYIIHIIVEKTSVLIYSLHCCFYDN